MNEYIINECQLGYSQDFYKVTTDAPLYIIEKSNTLEHRATWVKIKDIANNLREDGYHFEFNKINPDKEYILYLKDENFIQLKYGNY